MASGDAGQIIRILEEMKRDLADLKRKIEAIESTVNTIKSRQLR